MPASKLKLIWTAITIVLLIYTGTYVPYKVAYSSGEKSFTDDMEMLIDFLFFLDIIVNFISAYEDKERNLEFRLHKIALTYVTSWFFLDVVSSIPYQLMEADSNEPSSKALLKLAKIPRLYRLLRMLRLVKMMRLIRYNRTVKKYYYLFKLNPGVTKMI